MIRGGVVVALAALTFFGVGGCAKKRIPECDAVVKTIEKVATCPKVADEQRKNLLDDATTIRGALQKIDEAGGVGDAAADLVSSMRSACKTQDASLQQMYADCLK